MSHSIPPDARPEAFFLVSDDHSKPTKTSKYTRWYLNASPNWRGCDAHKLPLSLTDQVTIYNELDALRLYEATRNDSRFEDIQMVPAFAGEPMSAMDVQRLGWTLT